MTQISSNIVPLSYARIRRSATAAGNQTNTGNNRDKQQSFATAQAVQHDDQNQNGAWDRRERHNRRKTDRRGNVQSAPQSAKVTSRYASAFAAQVAGQWFAQSDACTSGFNTNQVANDAYHRTCSGQPPHLALVDINVDVESD